MMTIGIGFAILLGGAGGWVLTTLLLRLGVERWFNEPLDFGEASLWLFEILFVGALILMFSYGIGLVATRWGHL